MPITRYELEARTSYPDFEFMVTRNGYFDYWLFTDFDSAVKQAQLLQKQHPHEIILIYEPYFNTTTREWHAQNTFRIVDNKLTYDKHALPLLHLKFYTDAGEWQNPEIFNN